MRSRTTLFRVYCGFPRALCDLGSEIVFIVNCLSLRSGWEWFQREQKALAGEPTATTSTVLSREQLAQSLPRPHVYRGCRTEGSGEDCSQPTREVIASRNREEVRQEATAKRQLQCPAGMASQGLLSLHPAESPPPGESLPAAVVTLFMTQGSPGAIEWQ